MRTRTRITTTNISTQLHQDNVYCNNTEYASTFSVCVCLCVCVCAHACARVRACAVLGHGTPS